jgi:hypothetical protein
VGKLPDVAVIWLGLLHVLEVQVLDREIPFLYLSLYTAHS